jgi:hypothetical protein
MSAEILKTWAAKGLLTAALVCAFSAGGVRAQAPAGDDAAGLKIYEKALSAADPAAARAFLDDAAFTGRLKVSDPQKAAALTAQARAVRDLEELLAKPWRDDQEFALSQALSLRIDFNTPLEKVGIGAAPESLLTWMAKYGKYSEHKTGLVKRAIRQFEAVSGAVEEDKQSWDKTTIRERNAVLAQQAFESLVRLINNETATDKAFQDRIRSDEAYKYLDPAGRARYNRYLKQLSTAESAKAKLSAAQLDGIKDQPIEQQMYLLGELFDNSKGRGAVSLERHLDGARQSAPGETLSFQNNRLLTEMLRTAVPREIKDTAAGDKALSFYRSGARLELAIESCRGCYAKYEPSAGRIILDSDMIQQYLRVNNIATEDLLTDKARIDALAAYVSPMVVHEAAHQMQHDWADKAGVYKPYVQEDEIEANSLEALYTTEKLRKDPRFRLLFSGMRGTSTYADQRLKLAQRFNKSPDEFSEIVRRQYYYGLPSFDAASSQVLSAISAELERRKTLGEGELSGIEEYGAPLEDAMAMTGSEAASRVAEIKTGALIKIQADLMNKAAYSARYEDAADWSENALGTVRGSGGKTRSVPAL